MLRYGLAARAISVRGPGDEDWLFARKHQPRSPEGLRGFLLRYFEPVAPVVKRMIIRRFERRVPGSNPGGGKSEVRGQRSERVPVVELETTQVCEA